MVANRNSGNRANTPSRDYIDALTDYWNGRIRTAIEHVTQVLASQPDHEDVLPLYRLWIELLAEEGDIFALRSLSLHLQMRSENDARNYHSYFAMRGIIHIELDETEAVELHASALNTPSTNSYVREFEYRIAQRMEQEVSVGQFVSNPRNLRDYIHWQLYAQQLLLDHKTRDYKAAVKRVNEIFAGSPMQDRIEMHVAVENNEFEKSADLAKQLFRRFPSSTEYGLAQAYSLAKLGRHSEAIPVLTKLVAIDGEGDVDVISLLGHCYKEEYLATKNERSRERAGYYLRRAEALLTNMGLSAAGVNHDFNEVLSKNSASSSDSQRAWLVRVPQSEYLDIQLADEADLKFMAITISNEAAPGDICFIATEDYRDSGSRQMRVGAIYTVSSEPKWHPMYGTQSMLTLVGRPPVSLPIDIATVGADRRQTPERQRNVRAFELDGEALDQIVGKMEEYFADDVEAAKIFSELTRGRVVS
jgi:tetratricopeptide (TPR) repeat protein